MKQLLKAGRCLLAIAVLAGAPAFGAGWPERAVTMVVPFPPGGPTDLVARVLAKQLTQQLGQTVIVENKGGANGNIGMQYVAAAKNDGYTLLYNTSSIALSPNLYRALIFDPQRDFDGVSSTATIPLVLVTHPALPAANLDEFISYVAQRDGQLSYASAGAGNVTHLASILILQKLGLHATHVPYRGSSPGLMDLIGGQVQFMTNTLNDSLPFIREGRVRALAVTSAQRSPRLPDVPTLAETRLPGFEVGAWQGVVVPKGTPTAIVQRLNTEIQHALQSKEMLEQLAVQGAQPLGSSPQDYDAYLKSETARWGAVIQAAGIKLD